MTRSPLLGIALIEAGVLWLLRNLDVFAWSGVQLGLIIVLALGNFLVGRLMSTRQGES